MKHKPEREPSWTPRRRGAIYCASACGGSCTWAAYQKAVADADELVAALGGKWKPWVHENLGWHFTAVIRKGGYIILSVSRHKKVYLAIVGHRWHATATTPRAAVNKAVQAARAELDAMTKRVELIESHAIRAARK